ncbi:hypothetical protein LTR66_011005 [Elasticomyces elasticus]|nr:hypothetical protein LTR66_011005 [Elasticomyces elasticus]
MFEAILQELESDHEGLWCDQVCINQLDQAEKKSMIGAKDIIYKSARAVIVALDDIEFDERDTAALREYADFVIKEVPDGTLPFYRDPSYMKTRPHLQSCLKKIIYSEYFERAWCGHELAVGKEHVFLARFHDDGTEVSNKIVRFTGEVLCTLLELSLLVELSPDEANERKLMLAILFMRLYQDYKPAELTDDTLRIQLQHNFMIMMTVIFPMKAGGDPLLPYELRAYDGNNDKVSIVLNGSESGLMLNRTMHTPDKLLGATRSVCLQRLMLVTLAEGNPLVLCTTGAPLQLTSNTYSWLNEFQTGDGNVNEGWSPLPPNWNCRYIELDLLIPHIDSIHTASRVSIDIATKFLSECKDHSISSGPLFESLTATEQEFWLARVTFATRLLACYLDLGHAWFECFPQPPGIAQGFLQDPRILSNAIVQLFGEYEDRPRERWWGKSKRHKAAQVLYRAIWSAIERSCPNATLEGFRDWEPGWFEAVDGGRTICFVPNDGKEYTLAIPDVLRNETYERLARGWILEKQSSDSGGCERGQTWVLRGKSRIFGTSNFENTGTFARNTRWKRVWERQFE